MSNYCRECKREVKRCWSTDSGCSGGGHCLECMGDDFETDEEQEEREVNETLNKVLASDHGQILG